MSGKNMITVEIQGGKKSYPEGITFGEIAKEYEASFAGGIAAAFFNGNLRELFQEVNKDGVVEFLDMKTSIGHSAYMRTAVLLFVKAVNDVIGGSNIHTLRLEFSMNTGYYFSYNGAREVTQKLIGEIMDRMRQMVEAHTPIRKDTFPLSEARTIFESQNMSDKIKTCRFRKGRDINLYEVDGYFDYFYGSMLPDMEKIKWFEVLSYKGGFIFHITF